MASWSYIGCEICSYDSGLGFRASGFGRNCLVVAWVAGFWDLSLGQFTLLSVLRRVASVRLVGCWAWGSMALFQAMVIGVWFL